jgi:hypothetical protein
MQYSSSRPSAAAVGVAVVIVVALAYAALNGDGSVRYSHRASNAATIMVGRST